MQLKKLSFATLLAMFGTSAMAATSSIPVGSNLGYGDASNNNTIFATTANPSWVAGNIHRENNYGFGITGGVRFQQQDFNSFNSRYKSDVKPILDNFGSGNNQSTAILEAQALEKNLNNLVLDLRDKFHFQVDANASVPIVLSNGSWGGLGFEFSGTAAGRGVIVSQDRAVKLDPSSVPVKPSYNNTDLVDALEINSAIYLKSAVLTEGALTYGNQFFKNDDGQLAIGIRAKYMQVKLHKSVNSFKKYLSQSANGQNLSIGDDISKHNDTGDSDTNFGLDIGAQWFAKNWMAGLSVQNINSPKFNYNKLGVGSSTQAKEEQKYSTQYSLNESVELKAQAKLEAAYFSENRNWTIAGSADLNESNDLLNQKQQWVSVGASYATSSGDAWYYALVPDVRVGYRKNLVGDEAHYYTPGLTWGPLNLDVAFTEFSDLSKLSELTSKADENSDLPSGVQINIGLEFYF